MSKKLIDEKNDSLIANELKGHTCIECVRDCIEKTNQENNDQISLGNSCFDLSLLTSELQVRMIQEKQIIQKIKNETYN
tara:strand:- start:277 stop:513 length:237 start_codon:yes stop_codon:yes gene_type:complete